MTLINLFRKYLRYALPPAFTSYYVVFTSDGRFNLPHSSDHSWHQNRSDFVIVKWDLSRLARGAVVCSLLPPCRAPAGHEVPQNFPVLTNDPGIVRVNTNSPGIGIPTEMLLLRDDAWMIVIFTFRIIELSYEKCTGLLPLECRSSYRPREECNDSFIIPPKECRSMTRACVQPLHNICFLALLRFQREILPSIAIFS